MHSYKVKVYERTGGLAFAATLMFKDDGAAREGLASLPVSGRRIELYRGTELVGERPAESMIAVRRANR